MKMPKAEDADADAEGRAKDRPRLDPHTRFQQPHVGQDQTNDENGALSIKAKLIWSKPKHL